MKKNQVLKDRIRLICAEAYHGHNRKALEDLIEKVLREQEQATRNACAQAILKLPYSQDTFIFRHEAYAACMTVETLN